MESHVGGFDIFLVEGRDFVVEDLVFWDDALVLHTIECASTGLDRSPPPVLFFIRSTQVEFLSMLWSSI